MLKTLPRQGVLCLPRNTEKILGQSENRLFQKDFFGTIDEAVFVFRNCLERSISAAIADFWLKKLSSKLAVVYGYAFVSLQAFRSKICDFDTKATSQTVS